MYPNTFYRVSVKALITNSQGHVLVLKENQDTWSLPGGGLNHGEDPRAGIARELQEELGINSPAVEGIVSIQTLYLETKQAWLLWVVYGVRVEDYDFTLGNGVTEARFIVPGVLKTSQDIFEQAVYRVSSGMTS